MSKTIRNERTRGFLDKLQKSRKERKQIRDMKCDPMMFDFELSPRNRTFVPAT